MRAKFSTVKGSTEVTLIADNDPDRVMLSDVFMCSSNERRLRKRQCVIDIKVQAGTDKNVVNEVRIGNRTTIRQIDIKAMGFVPIAFSPIDKIIWELPGKNIFILNSGTYWGFKNAEIYQVGGDIQFLYLNGGAAKRHLCHYLEDLQKLVFG